jgi:pSer/pThr/pTyr-binding forkhead associated (FHA) protein
MLFRLVVERKGQRTRSIEVRTSVANIGRAHGNDVRIPSAQVSRKHCELREKDGLVVVEDLESVNGTFLNDDLITGVAVVRPGDRVVVGPITFVVEYEPTPKAQERLRGLDYEVVDDEVGEDIVLEMAEDEDTEVASKPRLRPKPPGEEILEVEEVAEEAQASLLDLEDVSWTPPDKGDLHDLLSKLDHGAESMPPKKKPAPRKRDEWAAAPPPKKNDKGDKGGPKPEE